MDLLENLGISTTWGTIGFGLLVIGAFLILAGIGIISIQQITVKQGKATWIVGLALAVVGALLIYPDVAGPEIVIDADVPAQDIQASAPVQDQAQTGELSEWRPISFTYPSNDLWREEDGAYTAVGSTNTIAWSEEASDGDLEIMLEVSSSSSSNSAANIIVYGNGTFLTEGNLIFTVASDLLAISETSIFEGEGGSFLHATMASLDLHDQVHTVLISIKDRKASMSLDGDEIGTIFLDDDIRSGGSIGLLKIGEISDISFGNIRVRHTEP